MIRKLADCHEPTAGLDPEERVRFEICFRHVVGRAHCDSFSHIVSDVEAVATIIALIAHGNLCARIGQKNYAAVEGKSWDVLTPSAQLRSLNNSFGEAVPRNRRDGVHARVVSEVAPVGAGKLLKKKKKKSAVA